MEFVSAKILNRCFDWRGPPLLERNIATACTSVAPYFYLLEVFIDYHIGAKGITHLSIQSSSSQIGYRIGHSRGWCRILLLDIVVPIVSVSCIATLIGHGKCVAVCTL